MRIRMYAHLFWVLTVFIFPHEYHFYSLARKENGLALPHTLSVPGTYLIVSALHVGHRVCVCLHPMAQQAQCDSGGGNGNETLQAACVLCARFRVSPNACGSERPHLQRRLWKLSPSTTRKHWRQYLHLCGCVV